MKTRAYRLGIIFFLFLNLSLISQTKEEKNKTNPPIYIAFLWHMHQPIYWPYENVTQTAAANRYSYSLYDIFNQRVGPYTAWPKTAVQKGINENMAHFGAQVSFSGSLVENLNNLESAGNQNFTNWKSHWNYIKNQKTSLNNPRLDMVGFGYYHPLMGLIDETDIRKQVQEHKRIFAQNFTGSYSKGIFPPENAFSPRMIPALVKEGFEWVLVDNIHFDRACLGYPYATGGNLYEPNKADQVNPNPNDWIQLNGLWAPTKVSAGWGHRPHYVQYIDPATGQSYKIIAVPTSRYLGNEDGRGGFGALNYEQVLSQLEQYNTDPNHPILVVLHHDGDNYGGGSEGYYNNNFQNFVNWLKENPTRFVCTTIQDYLDMFPPSQNDLIHIEDGSWSGADNGDPEFLKWNGHPGSDGYSPDRNSWGIMTAAKNFVQTAEQINANSNDTKLAWKYYLVGQTSCYWYWDGSENGIWDSHPARAANLAIPYAKNVIQTGQDQTGPTIYLPQRKPYNPGEKEWLINQPSNMNVWTYVFDISGLKYVKLKYRYDYDGVNDPNTNHNETYAGGSDVSDWQELEMAGTYIPSRTNPAPLYKAKEFSALISGLANKLVNYYVEAEDSLGNISRSPIREVWIGSNSGSGGGSGSYQVLWTPTSPTKNDTIKIFVVNSGKTGKLHWGVNNWATPLQSYWPQGTELYQGSGPAVQTPLQIKGSDTLYLALGPFNNPAQSVSQINFVINYYDNSWDNNNGQDYKILIAGSGQDPISFVMDGQLDASASLVASGTDISLYAAYNGKYLYVATEGASVKGKDAFIFICDNLNTLVSAPWAKQGQMFSWVAYLANESSNNWSGWFDALASKNSFSGQYLEGIIDIKAETNNPQLSQVYLAAARYETQDNGALTNQAPSGNGDNVLNQNEYFVFSLTQTSVDKNGSNPVSFSLEQNYPNPFNPVTKIKFSIPDISGKDLIRVTLKVYDVLGNQISVLFDGELKPGYYETYFDSKNALSSGVYFYELRTDYFRQIKKMTLLK